MIFNILLIDDDIKNSVFLKQIIESEGYSVTYASDGVAGWELFKAMSPHLILLDINMPGINGFDLARKIRLQNKDVLIFFLSDRTEKEDRLQGFEVEGNDYIPKPFYPEELIAKIKERTRNIAKQTIFHLGNTTYNSNLSTITIGEKVHTISGRQNEILLILANNVGKMVTRESIMESVWGDASFANSMGLNVQINYLRNALSSDPSVTIETLPKRGYLLKIIGK